MRKRAMLAEIDRLPRRSGERMRAYLAMHAELAQLRERDGRARQAGAELERARRYLSDARIANTRTWAFPLYPSAMIDELAGKVGAAVSG
jgi:hypothetical protein